MPSVSGRACVPRGPTWQSTRSSVRASVVTRYCRTAEEQARAVAALSFKCDVLWSVLDGIDRAYPE